MANENPQHPQLTKEQEHREDSNYRFRIAVTHSTFVVAILVASTVQTAKVATANSITGIAERIQSHDWQ